MSFPCLFFSLPFDLFHFFTSVSLPTSLFFLLSLSLSLYCVALCFECGSLTCWRHTVRIPLDDFELDPDVNIIYIGISPDLTAKYAAKIYFDDVRITAYAPSNFTIALAFFSFLFSSSSSIYKFFAATLPQCLLLLANLQYAALTYCADSYTPNPPSKLKAKKIKKKVVPLQWSAPSNLKCIDT